MVTTQIDQAAIPFINDGIKYESIDFPTPVKHLEYPAELPKEHNNYLLAPEKKVVNGGMYVGLPKEFNERHGDETPRTARSCR